MLIEGQTVNVDYLTNNNENFAIWINALERVCVLKSSLEFSIYFKRVKVDK